MLCTFLSPEVPFYFNLGQCFYWGIIKSFMLDLARPFSFELICGEAHAHEGKVDIIRHNTTKANGVTPT